MCGYGTWLSFSYEDDSSKRPLQIIISTNCEQTIQNGIAKVADGFCQIIYLKRFLSSLGLVKCLGSQWFEEHFP